MQCAVANVSRICKIFDNRYNNNVIMRSTVWRDRGGGYFMEGGCLSIIKQIKTR